MGVVYKALDRNLDRVVALKVLKTGAVESPEELRQFEREAKTISSLNHPHIATIHDRGEVDGKHYLIFEFLSGGTLKAKLTERIAHKELFTVDEVVRYATEVGQGLAHAHRQGVIHRDIKTENLLLTADGSVKVTDFGLAQWNTIASTTSGHSASGTAAYMSPEQAQGLAIDERSDIFSFGLVLYELLTGEAAFQGLYVAAVVYDIINSPTPSVLDKRPDTPEHLCRVVERATAKSPDDRYRSMDELFADLAHPGEQGNAGVTAAASQPAATPRRTFSPTGSPKPSSPI
jgi:serine/threonine protein kinase